MEGTSIDVYRSNHAERLVDCLLNSVRKPLSHPLKKELIIVQGPGMATWLNMQLAKRVGVWANAEYLYPKRFIERMFAHLLALPEPEAATTTAYSPESLLWTIAARLPQHLTDPAFEALRRYVGEPVDEARLFMLAARIADTYDEYITYRPNLVRLWAKNDAHFAEPQLELFQRAEASDPAVWQRKLWRDIETTLGANHAAAFERRCLTALQRRKRSSDLPERISVFGLSALPPMYVRILVALSKQVPVALYTFSPCREYYADLVLRDALAFAPSDGNRVLRALGRQGAEFDQVLTESLEALGVAEREFDAYHSPAGMTLLQRLQADILGCRETTASTAADDRSVQFHSCHSAIREVEVLHDQILDLVHVQGYSPDEILVMLPDVEAYAPLIDAVFRRDDERFLPYRVADRRAESEAVVLKAFLRVLRLANERVTAAQVIDLLTLPVVHRQFGMTAEDVQTVTAWLADANITWGMDDVHRQSELPNASSTNSWRAGLDRLLLGYTVDSNGDELIYDIYPSQHIEGKEASLLGSFAQFLHTLFTQLNQFREPRTMVDWQGLLTQTLQALIYTDRELHWQYQQVLDTLDALRQQATSADYDKPLGLRVVLRLLDQRLEQRGAARGFLAGGITVCAMVPMRNVPFKVICIMGMNDGAFPRESFRPDFNLLEHGEDGRRPGDPDRRSDDRYLFLEALCSARERFIVTFVGQSIRDNTFRPPSVVVTELLETLSAMHETQTSTATGAARKHSHYAFPDHALIRHPLQPFSARYFDHLDAQLFSYSNEFVPRHESPSLDRPYAHFLSHPLTSNVGDSLSLADLAAFYRSPVRYLMERSLGVRWQEHVVALPDRDRTCLDPLQAYELGEPLMKRELAGVPLEQSRAVAASSGLLPAGMLGHYEHRKLEETALPLSRVARALINGRTSTQTSVRSMVGTTLLSGVVTDLYGDVRIVIQFARVTGRTLLRQWLAHLALGLDGISPPHCSTLIAGRAATGSEPVVWKLSAVSDPAHVLQTLLELFRLGTTCPLPLFPDLSFDYARAPSKMTPAKLATGWATALERDAALARVFGEDCPLMVDAPLLPTGNALPALTFGQVALQVFGPLTEHLTELDWREVLQ